MKEEWVQEAWQGLFIKREQLRCRAGKELRVLDPGRINHGQGPDFLDSRILLEGQELFGAVEIHVKGEDWYRHQHHRDPLYNSVVLHATVHPGRQLACRLDGTKIPELILGDVLLPGWQERFSLLQLSRERIPCGAFGAGDIKTKALAEAGEERLLYKRSQAKATLQSLAGDWDQALRIELGASLAGPVNGQAFRDLLRGLDSRHFNKCKGHPQRMEALLLGKAGLLSQKQCKEGYPMRLYQEWVFLRELFGLRPGLVPLRHLGMRPQGQPLRRLLQLAHVLILFPEPSCLLSEAGRELFEQCTLGVSDYWREHQNFGKPRAAIPWRLGASLKQRLVVNVLLPFALLYSEQHGRELRGEVLAVLRGAGAERNRVTQAMKAAGFEASNALEAQGAIHLYKEYCVQRHCLSCKVGRSLLTRV